MTLVERLRGLGADLGRVANKDAFTPSERGRSAAEIAVTVLEAADALEAAERERDRLRRFIYSETPIPAQEVAEHFWARERTSYDGDYMSFRIARLTSVIERARQDGAAHAKGIAEAAESRATKAEAEAVRLREALVKFRRAKEWLTADAWDDGPEVRQLFAEADASARAALSPST